ncbi:MAG: hypothetical protein GQ558_06940 [Thermoplasmata archaeon]|nr:hypothetical protein [Thermoplasmata archaeon]
MELNYDLIFMIVVLLWPLTWVLWTARQVAKRIAVVNSWTPWLPILYPFIYLFGAVAITGESGERWESLVIMIVLVVGYYLVFRFIGKPVVYNASLGTLKKALERVFSIIDVPFTNEGLSESGYARVDYFFEKEGVGLRFDSGFMTGEYLGDLAIYINFRPRLRAFRLENRVVRELKRELNGKPADGLAVDPFLLFGFGILIIIIGIWFYISKVSS